MLRQDAGGEQVHLAIREVELARAAEHSRRVREAANGADRRPGRIRAAALTALRAAMIRLDPALEREPQLGRDGGC